MSDPDFAQHPELLIKALERMVAENEAGDRRLDDYGRLTEERVREIIVEVLREELSPSVLKARVTGQGGGGASGGSIGGGFVEIIVPPREAA